MQFYLSIRLSNKRSTFCLRESVLGLIRECASPANIDEVSSHSLNYCSKFIGYSSWSAEIKAVVNHKYIHGRTARRYCKSVLAIQGGKIEEGRMEGLGRPTRGSAASGTLGTTTSRPSERL